MVEDILIKLFEHNNWANAQIIKTCVALRDEQLDAEPRSAAHGSIRLQTRDGYYVEPWVVIVQIINHATEHREQIKNMLSSLGVTPPDIDGWDYGFVTNTLVPISA